MGARSGAFIRDGLERAVVSKKKTSRRVARREYGVPRDPERKEEVKPPFELRFSLQQKRRIVRSFKSGNSTGTAMIEVRSHELVLRYGDLAIQQVIRDYMNGKFKLPKNGPK